MSFKVWLGTLGIFSEGQTVSQYLKQNGIDNQDEVFQIPEVKDFMEKVIIKHPLSLKRGKMGVWVRGDMVVPVQITFTQQTTITLRKQNGQTWEDIEHLWPTYADDEKKEIIVPKSRAILVQQEPFKYFIDWFTYIYENSGENDMEDFFRRFFMEYGERLESLIGKYEQFKNTDLNLDNLPKTTSKEDEKIAKDSRSNSTGPDGKVFIEFPNGWKWLDLECPGSPAEGAAAGHCGNGQGGPGENLFSLRDADNRIHITVVVKDGTTNEFKAPGNKKPKRYTHPYIVEFLKHHDIKKVGPAKWNDQENFQITDLDYRSIADLARARPDMIIYTPIQEAAVKARGNQREFQQLVKDHYGLSEFPYYYDYNDQSILIDQGPVNYMADKYKLMKYWGAGDHEPVADKDVVPDNVRNLEWFTFNMFEIFWEQLNRNTQDGILKLLAPDTDPDKIRDVHYLVRHSDNPNFKKALQHIGSAVVSEMFYTINNRGSRSGDSDGFYVKLKPQGQTTSVSLMLLPEIADSMLSEFKKIDFPERISVHIIHPEHHDVQRNDTDWFNAFYHAVEKSRFWERLEYSDSGQTASKEMDQYPGLAEKQAMVRAKNMELARKGLHPMQIQVRNEQIRRELSDRMGTDSYDNYIEELKKKGWWEPFLKWAHENRFYI